MLLLMFSICCSCTKPRKQELYLEWDGKFSLGDYRGKSPESEDIVCIVQYAHRPSPRFMSEVEGTKWNCYNAVEEQFGRSSHNVIEVYSDKDQIEQILRCLEHPEYPEYYTVESEHCLMLISLSRMLTAQTLIRVPFVLTNNGDAVTRKGKDGTLFGILNSALENRDIQLKDEKEKGNIHARNLEIAHRLYQQARESDTVDYKTLFRELEKLNVTFGAKDPNELEQKLRKDKEPLSIEQLPLKKTDNDNSKPIF